MLAMKKALTDIKNRIPIDILNLAFMSRISLIPGKVTTLDKQIELAVLKNIVLQDCNIIGGENFVVKLDDCPQYVVDYGEEQHLAIDIPYELTNNKEVLAVYEATYGAVGTELNGGGTSGNDVMAMGTALMNATTGNIGGYETTNVELIGPNTVVIHESITRSVGGTLRITVENDKNFRNINPRQAIAFSKMVLLATKGYIYNKLTLEIDKGYIYGGHDLGKIVETIDKYEDAWDEYDEYLKTKWAKISFINDNIEHASFIKLAIQPIV